MKTVAILSLLVLSGAARQVDAPPVVFSGSVVDAVTGQPVAGARVRIGAGISAPPDFDVGLPRATVVAQVTSTDSLGSFEFRDFEPGAYTLSVDRDGYVVQVYGQRTAFGRPVPIDIVPGGNDAVVVRLTPAATLSGSVTDPDEQAVAGISVYLLRTEFTPEGERLRALIQALTDATGRYALTDIPPGSYYVAAGPSGLAPGPQRGLPAYRWTYYPGVSEAALAGSIGLLAGTRIDGIDLTVAPAELFSVRGRVVDSRTGEPPPSVRVMLVRRLPFIPAGTYSLTEVPIAIGARYDPEDGTFGFEGVPEGRYRLDANLPLSDPDGAFARLLDFDFMGGAIPDAHLILDVDGDVGDLDLRVPGGGLLRGEVRVTGGVPLSDLGETPPRFGLEATEPLQPFVARTPVAPNGTFEVVGSLSGRYRFFLLPLPDNFYVSEARLNGARVTSEVLSIPKDAISELRIELSPDGGEVRGRVLDRDGQPLTGVQGLLLPDPLPRTLDRYREVYLDAEGLFVLRGVPPGTWRIYVWEDFDLFAYFDPDLLRRSTPDATPVRVDARSRILLEIEAIRSR